LGQAPYAIAIGSACATRYQKQGAISIGYRASQYSQGVSSIAIGNYANGRNSQQPNYSILLDATGTGTTVVNANSCVVKPVRNVDNAVAAGLSMLWYNPITGEITYGSA
jgi:hypothetical protein